MSIFKDLNDYEILKTKLNKENIYTLNDRDDSLLHIAIDKGCELRIIKLLIEKGSDINYNNTYSGYSALHLAVEYENEELVKLLLSYEETETELITMNYETALHIACKYNNYNIVKLLVESGSEINQYNDKGILPIGLTNSKKITKYLLEKGSYINKTELTLKEYLEI
jgi:ankyrin repeat protein